MSCIDRAFANNINIPFSTPENFFFDDKKFILWESDRRILTKPERYANMQSAKYINIPIILDEINTLPQTKNYIIIVMGPPSSGKTTLATKIKRKWDADANKGIISIVSFNQTNCSEDKWIENSGDKASDGKNISKEHNIASLINDNKSVIVELIYNKDSIIYLIKKSIELKCSTLIIEIKTSSKMIHLLNHLTIQNAKDSNMVLIKKKEIDDYFAKYVEMNYKDIVCVRHIHFPLILINSAELNYDYALY